MGWSLCSGKGGQFNPVLGGQFDRIFQSWQELWTFSNVEVIRDITKTSQEELFAASTCYLGGVSPGGVYRSIDFGDNWEQVGLSFHFVSSIESDHYDTLFAGTNGHYYNGNGGVFKSSDKGSQWGQLYSNNLVNVIAINDYNTILIGCSDNGYQGGIFRSFDNGNTWTDISAGLNNREIQDIEFGPDNFTYTITYAPSGFYRSIDAISNVFCEKVEHVKVHPNPANNNIVLKGLNPHNTYYGRILNAGGHVMMDFELTDNRIGIENLENGVYFLVLISNDQRYVSKFIKY